MESPLVLDGFIDLFHFSDGEKSNDIESGNIRCFASDPSSNAGKVLSLSSIILDLIYSQAGATDKGGD